MIKWDYKDGLLVRRYKLEGSLHALYTTNKTDEQFCVYVICKKSGTSEYHTYIIIWEPVSIILILLYGNQ